MYLRSFSQHALTTENSFSPTSHTCVQNLLEIRRVLSWNKKTKNKRIMLLQTLPSLEKESQANALLVLVVCAAALGTQIRAQDDRDIVL